MVKGQWLAVLKQGRETAIALINNRTVKKIRAHSLNLLLIYNIKGFKSVKCCHTLSLESIKPYLVSTPKCPQGGSRDRIYINIHPEQWQRNTWSRKCPTLCFPNVPHFQKWKKMHFNAKLRGKKIKRLKCNKTNTKTELIDCETLTFLYFWCSFSRLSGWVCLPMLGL